jgi:hypothetical protein
MVNGRIVNLGLIKSVNYPHGQSAPVSCGAYLGLPDARLVA